MNPALREQRIREDMQRFKDAAKAGDCPFANFYFARAQWLKARDGKPS